MKKFRARAVDCSSANQQIMASRDSSRLLRTMFRLLKSGNFKLQAKPEVVFLNESGIDAEGLTRELCHMVMACLRDGKGDITLFKGVIGHLLPVHKQYLASKYFLYAGTLIAHAVLHAGFGLVGLAKVIKEYTGSGMFLPVPEKQIIFACNSYSFIFMF